MCKFTELTPVNLP